MRYAIISDIHGNLAALESVLDNIQNHSVDSIICLGDIVGYYPDPTRCVELVQEHATYSVAGNHDYAAIGKLDHRNFTLYAYVAMEWTKKHLSDNARKFLTTLPLKIEMDDMFFTHSSPCNPQDFSQYVFPDSDEAIFEAFSSLVRKVNFIGHTHWPSIMLQDDDRIVLHGEDTIHINGNHYYLINVGSVGQPRNFDPRSCYAIYDTEEKTVELMRVKYDFSITQRRIAEAHLPEFLANRLAKGR
ncbi:MAG: metallophosphoesterase family protein [Chitinispirillaceae bacterium]